MDRSYPGGTTEKKSDKEREENLKDAITEAAKRQRHDPRC